MDYVVTGWPRMGTQTDIDFIFPDSHLLGEFIFTCHFVYMELAA
jgi:hypothetical protein